MNSRAPFVKIENTYAQQLPDFSVTWQGETIPNGQLLILNRSLAESLGCDLTSIDEELLTQWLSGEVPLPGGQTIAQVYAGHQFGHFNPQLGDGRAILIGEVIDNKNQRIDIHLKGSGRTPFSRNGDGKAVLGPMLREYLISEAMYALDIPTTRSLAVIATGETIMRQQPLPGAILARTASSHIRVGTFQYYSAQGQFDKVKQLADYAIWRHYPELAESNIQYLELLKAVIVRQAQTIAKWMSVGFIHGVMNTDNMTISGETIDYGPCAFMDSYSPATVFSSIDKRGRYAYANQPVIAKWNLARFAESLLPLIDENEKKALQLATDTLNEFDGIYQGLWLRVMTKKLGMRQEDKHDLNLINEFLDILEKDGIDFTQAFSQLSHERFPNKKSITDLFKDNLHFAKWKIKWEKRLENETCELDEQLELMRIHNPVYIPRNHLVEEALEQAQQNNNLSAFNDLLGLLQSPFSAREGYEEYTRPAPDSFTNYQTFCGT